jgi:hypothetical protein
LELHFLFFINLRIKGMEFLCQIFLAVKFPQVLCLFLFALQKEGSVEENSPLQVQERGSLMGSI